MVHVAELKPGEVERVDRRLPLNRLCQHQEEGSTYLIAWVGQEPVGNLCLQLEGPPNPAVRGRVVAGPELSALSVYEAWRDQGIGSTIFMIGGADGLSPELRRRAKLRIAFGSATWPHQMVRIMLLEQLYRAATILAGHPYHRT